MDGKTKYLLKNTSILAISNFSSKLLVFLLVPLYTNILSTEEYGTYDLIMSTIQFVTPFFTLNITDGVLRYLMEKAVVKKEVKIIGFKYIVLSNIGVVVCLSINHYFNFWPRLKELELYVFLYFFFYVFNQLFIQTAKGQEQVKALGIAGIISTVVSLVSNILLLVIFSCGLKGFFTAYILGQALSALYLYNMTSYYDDISVHVNKYLEKDMLKYSLPLIGATVGWAVNNVSDRYIVTWLCGLAVNGIYSVSYKIPTIINMVQNIFIQAWVISSIKEYESDNRNEFYQETFVKLNFLMVGCCSTLILGTKVIAKILYAKDFYSAWQYVPFLLISVVFGASSGFIGPILSAEKKTKVLANSTLHGAVVNFILNIILIYFIGAQGAAIATALSNVVIYMARKRAIGSLLYIRKYKQIIFSWSLLTIQAVIMVLDWPIILQLPLMAFLLFLYRSTLLQFFHIASSIINN